MDPVCLLILNFLKRLNGFDEDYFLIAEETDLCYRIRKKTDYKIVYYLGAKIVHIKSLVTGKNTLGRLKQSYISKLIFFNKHYLARRTYILKNFIVLIFTVKRFFLFGKKIDKTKYWEAYSDIINHYREN